jgi:hypothetical protein
MVSRSIMGMSVDALMKLRDDIESALSQKARELQTQFARLGGETRSGPKRRGSTLKGRKVPIKFRDKSGNTWAGRGAMPVWLREKINFGARLGDFAVDKSSRGPRKKTKSEPRPNADRRCNASWGASRIGSRQTGATSGPPSQRLGSASPEKIAVITEKRLAPLFGQAFFSPEIMVPKVPQQVSTTPLVISPASPNARHIEIA